MLVSGLRGVEDGFVVFRKVFARVGKGSGRDVSVISKQSALWRWRGGGSYLGG